MRAWLARSTRPNQISEVTLAAAKAASASRRRHRPACSPRRSAQTAGRSARSATRAPPACAMTSIVYAVEWPGHSSAAVTS